MAMKTFDANNHRSDNADRRNLHGRKLRGLLRVKSDNRETPFDGIINALTITVIVGVGLCLIAHWQGCTALLASLWGYLGEWVGKQTPSNLLTELIGIVAAGAIAMSRGR